MSIPCARMKIVDSKSLELKRMALTSAKSLLQLRQARVLTGRMYSSGGYLLVMYSAIGEFALVSGSLVLGLLVLIISRGMEIILFSLVMMSKFLLRRACLDSLMNRCLMGNTVPYTLLIKIMSYFWNWGSYFLKSGQNYFDINQLSSGAWNDQMDQTQQTRFKMLQQLTIALCSSQTKLMGKFGFNPI